MSLTPAQSRAARGWINWTQAELAEKGQVGLSTLRDFESGKRTPIQNNVAAIRRALEDGGAGELLLATDRLGVPVPAVSQIPAAGQGKRQETDSGAKHAKRSRR